MIPEQTTLERLLALATEAERILAFTMASEEIRDACAIARGHLDMVRLYGEPLNIDDVERVLARIGGAIGDEKFRRRFLTRLRSIAGWARLTPADDAAPQAAPA